MLNRDDIEEVLLPLGGVIVRMIAAVAWREHAALLARDADLLHVARTADIELD